MKNNISPRGGAVFISADDPEGNGAGVTRAKNAIQRRY